MGRWTQPSFAIVAKSRADKRLLLSVWRTLAKFCCSSVSRTGEDHQWQ